MISKNLINNERLISYFDCLSITNGHDKIHIDKIRERLLETNITNF